MLGNILNLRDTQIQDIMCPRAKIKALPITASLEDLLEECTENQISSVIIYRGNMDNILGVVWMKDIVNWFYMNKPFSVTNFIKDILFVPPTMRTLTLLLQMKNTGIKVAIIVDEYGGCEGFISFMDLVEEIIGDIQSANGQKSRGYKKLYKEADGAVVADASVTLKEVQKATGIKFCSHNNSIESLGGYIFTIAGKVPVIGELVVCKKQNVEFEILKADPRYVKSVKIRKIT
jgi:CBS domain containing-hemolysin-like protein